MFLYCAFFLLVSVIFFEADLFLDPLFRLAGVPSGFRTLVVQGMNGAVCLGILATHRGAPGALREIRGLLFLWIPWLLYLIYRTDFNEPYAELKLGRVVALQFVSLIYVALVYCASPQRFERYFVPVLIVVALALLAVFAASPTLFDPNRAARLTIEGVSPIWLARTFAYSSISLFLVQWLPTAVAIGLASLLVVGIIVTASRGPLVSLVAAMGYFWMVRQSQSKYFALKLVALLSVLAAIAINVAPYLQGDVEKFFTRGRAESVMESSGRADLFSRAVEDGMSAPMMGVGLGKFGKAGYKTSDDQDGSLQTGEREFLRLYPHNLILEIFAELGLVGLMFVIVLLRPGRWLLNFRGRYIYLFVLSFLFAMTSGDLPENSGLFLFALLARLEHRRTTYMLDSGGSNAREFKAVRNTARILPKRRAKILS